MGAELAPSRPTRRQTDAIEMRVTLETRVSLWSAGIARIALDVESTNRAIDVHVVYTVDYVS